MANKTVTVKPSGGTYTTLAGAIAGELTANANLVTMDGILTISIEGDWSGGPDTDLVLINGFTTDATRYLNIVTDAANKAGPKYSSTKYRLELSNNHCLAMRDDYVRVDGLQIYQTGADAVGESCIYVYVITATNNDIRISNCYLKGTSDATNYTNGLRSEDADTNLKVWNTIATGHAGNSAACGFVMLGATCVHYNCIAYGCYRGFRDVGMAGSTVVNCASFGNDDDFLSVDTITTCVSDDDDAGADLAHSADWSSDFVNAAGGDFTLKSGSQLIGAGTVDPGAGLFSDDIDGDVRGVAWDIGADEYVAAGGATVPLFKSESLGLRGLGGLNG